MDIIYSRSQSMTMTKKAYAFYKDIFIYSTNNETSKIVFLYFVADCQRF